MIPVFTFRKEGKKTILVHADGTPVRPGELDELAAKYRGCTDDEGVDMDLDEQFDEEFAEACREESENEFFCGTCYLLEHPPFLERVCRRFDSFAGLFSKKKKAK